MEMEVHGSFKNWMSASPADRKTLNVSPSAVP